MKTLILCIDRDDDVGRKGGVVTPCVGRRRCLDAAVALGLADPEDSDVNAILAAVSLHDRELRGGTGQAQIEVAVIAGDVKMGLSGDRKLSGELDQVLQQARPDEVILVSDGAEDEAVMPILQSRVKIVHVHRSIVKQAPRLEGFYYTITRILDDPKQGRRFVLPLALLFLILAIGYLLGFDTTAWGVTLGLIGVWLVVRVMHWQHPIRTFGTEMGNSIRKGRLTILATIAMVLLLASGALFGLQEVRAFEAAYDAARASGMPVTAYPKILAGLVFVQVFLPYMIAAILVRIAGSLFDAWVREGRAGVRLWSMGFGLIAFGLIASALVDGAVDHLEGLDALEILTFWRVAQVLTGIVIAMGGFMVGRYVRQAVQARTAR